jgi:hypothetical protein
VDLEDANFVKNNKLHTCCRTSFEDVPMTSELSRSQQLSAVSIYLRRPPISFCCFWMMSLSVCLFSSNSPVFRTSSEFFSEIFCSATASFASRFLCAARRVSNSEEAAAREEEAPVHSFIKHQSWKVWDITHNRQVIGNQPCASESCFFRVAFSA